MLEQKRRMIKHMADIILQTLHRKTLVIVVAGQTDLTPSECQEWAGTFLKDGGQILWA
jgi:hypothetical protein